MSLVLAGVAGAVAVRQAGGDGGTSAGGAGWEDDRFGNSQLLAGDGERVCSVTPDSLVFCLDPATGEEVFTHQLYLSVVTSPVLADDNVLVAGAAAGGSGSMFAVTTGGEELWETPVEITTDRPMPVVGGVVAVVAGGDATGGTLVGIDAATGEERWRAYGPSAPDAARVVSTEVFTDGERLYLAVVQPGANGEGAGHVVAVDPGSGEELWRSPASSSITLTRGMTSIAPFDDGSALAVALAGSPLADEGPSGRVVALDAATGAPRWELTGVGPDTTVAHAEGLTVVVDGAEMTGLDAAGGEVWSAATPEGGDAGTADGQRLVRDGDRVFVVGHDVHQVDPATGGTALVLDSGTTRDVAVAGDHLVIASVLAVTAVPLESLPLADHGVTVATG